MHVKAGVLFRVPDSKCIILTNLKTMTMLPMWMNLQPVLV